MLSQEELNAELKRRKLKSGELVEVTVPEVAFVRERGIYSTLKMPDAFHGGFYFRVENQYLEKREGGYAVALFPKKPMYLFSPEKETVQLWGSELIDGLKEQPSDTYLSPKPERKKVDMTLPGIACLGDYGKSLYFQLPKEKGERTTKSYYLPAYYAKRQEDGTFKVTIPEDFHITVRDRSTNEQEEWDVATYFKKVSGKGEKSYRKPQEKEGRSDTAWGEIEVPVFAKVAEYESKYLFKMPQGVYQDYLFYLPKSLVHEHLEKSTMTLVLKRTSPKQLFKTENGERKTLDVSFEAMKQSFWGMQNVDFAYPIDVARQTRQRKLEVLSEQLTEFIPEEMRKRPNWVVCRTKQTEGKEHLNKFLLNPHDGTFAKSDDPTTWGTFEEAKQALLKLHGSSLAYALDGKDGIACIDCDHCVSPDGTYSGVAEEVLKQTPGFYTERSISGSGLHIFGKTNGLGFKSFSKDRSLELYETAHFMTMTGALLDPKRKDLLSFDEQPVETFLKAHFDLRTPMAGTRAGVEGLSLMSDRDVVETAIAAKNGQIFADLYRGVDVQNNHSNSDMALMTRLAFYCNGDRDQMLRIFATSGLYREEKHPSYYETTAAKALQLVEDRYTGKREQPTPEHTGGHEK